MRNRETDYLYSLTMNDYQADTAATAIYKWKVVYPALGLASEAGEVCDKIKKLIRDHGIPMLPCHYGFQDSVSLKSRSA